MFSLVSYETFKSIKKTSEIITKADKNMVNDLDYEDIKFLVSKIDFSKIKNKIIFTLMCFVMKMDWFILFMYQIKI